MAEINVYKLLTELKACSSGITKYAPLTFEAAYKLAAKEGELHWLATQLSVPPVVKGEATAALVKRAAKVGLTFSPALLTEIVRYVVDDDADLYDGSYKLLEKAFTGALPEWVFEVALGKETERYPYETLRAAAEKFLSPPKRKKSATKKATKK